MDQFKTYPGLVPALIPGPDLSFYSAKPFVQIPPTAMVQVTFKEAKS